MDYALNFSYERGGDPNNSQNARILEGYKNRLLSMRDMVLYRMSQQRITQSNLDMLERDLSDIIGGIDKLRRVPNIDEINSSLDEVQTKVRSARKCLNIASRLLEKATSLRHMDALFEKFEEFPDLLEEAIELLNC